MYASLSFPLSLFSVSFFSLSLTLPSCLPLFPIALFLSLPVSFPSICVRKSLSPFPSLCLSPSHYSGCPFILSPFLSPLSSVTYCPLSPVRLSFISFSLPSFSLSLPPPPLSPTLCLMYRTVKPSCICMQGLLVHFVYLCKCCVYA